LHSSSLTRLAALLAALALSWASIGEVAHRAFVQHVACEHGELLELPAAPRGQAPVGAASVYAASSHGHHHCALDDFHAPVVPRTIVVQAAQAHPEHLVTLHAVERDQRPLAYAPKTSPPV